MYTCYVDCQPLKHVLYHFFVLLFIEQPYIPILLSEVDARGDRHTILIRIPVDCHILPNAILRGCKVKVHGQSITSRVILCIMSYTAREATAL